MLPSPVSYPGPSSRTRQRLTSTTPLVPTSLAFWRSRLAGLLARSRVTNLGVVVLVGCLCVSVVVNVFVMLGREGGGRVVEERVEWEWEGKGRTIVKGGRYDNRDRERERERQSDVSPTVSLSYIPPSIDTTIRRPPLLRSLYHLVLVPCHGVWVGNKLEDVYDVDKWVLESFKRDAEEEEEETRARVRVFVEHVKKGVEIAIADPNALLVFSGAPTRPPTPLSESTSYLSLALTLGLIHPSPTSPSSSASSSNLFLRTTTEEHALDSYQNLLFSIARFREVVGSESVGGGYPRRITVVGFGMKQKRFEELHARALRWKVGNGRKVKGWEDSRLVREGEEELDDGPEPETGFNGPHWSYVGVDLDTVGSPRAHNLAEEGELMNGYGPFVTDLYGCHGALLRKRRSRNPYRRVHAYHVSAPEMASLLEWCPEGEKVGGGEDEGAEGYAPISEVYTKVFTGALPWDDLWDD